MFRSESINKDKINLISADVASNLGNQQPSVSQPQLIDQAGNPLLAFAAPVSGRANRHGCRHVSLKDVAGDRRNKSTSDGSMEIGPADHFRYRPAGKSYLSS